LPADARRRPAQRSDAAGHTASLRYELRDAREPPICAPRRVGCGPVIATPNSAICAERLVVSVPNVSQFNVRFDGLGSCHCYFLLFCFSDI
jgi:hypothetical protein